MPDKNNSDDDVPEQQPDSDRPRVEDIEDFLQKEIDDAGGGRAASPRADGGAGTIAPSSRHQFLVGDGTDEPNPAVGDSLLPNATEATNDAPSEPGGDTENEGDEPASSAVAVATCIDEQPIYQAQEMESRDPCCKVVFLGLNRKWFILAALCILASIIGGVTHALTKKDDKDDKSPDSTMINDSTADDSDSTVDSGLSFPDGGNTTVSVNVTTMSPTAADTLQPTTPPSNSPTAIVIDDAYIRVDNITDLIYNLSPGTPEHIFGNVSFFNPNNVAILNETEVSPQSKALYWLLHVDGLHLNMTSGTITDSTNITAFNVANANLKKSIIQRYALMTIYFSLRGEQWTNQRFWANGNPFVNPQNVTSECNWWGVTCLDGITVNYFQSRRNSANGTIPEEISLLTDLKIFELSQSNSYGTIPETMYDLSVLEYIYVYGNLLSGTISPRIGNLTNLRYLVLRNNQLTGTIPQEMEKLENLLVIRLYNNYLVGGFPGFFSNLTRLQILNIGGNQLTGTLPKAISELKSLKNLYFYDNFLSGSVPAEWGGMTTLNKLGFWNNMLNGTFPSEMTYLPSLTHLSIGENAFTGSFPYNDRLVELFFYRNLMTGTIEPGVGNMTRLRTLSGFQNKMTGSIPTTFGMMSSLSTLALSNNNLTGSIPTEFGNCINMLSINFGENNLTGTIPESIGMLGKLDSIRIGNNSLTGQIPEDLCSMGLTSLSTDCVEVNCTCCTCCMYDNNTETQC